jgi:branched-chain amino acid transport system permease protein
VLLANFLNIVFAGLAYGVLLFLMAAGLSVTMGLMRFANLAHAAFAMLGGYIAVTLMNGYSWPFLLTLPAAALGTAIFATVFERTIFRRLYRSDQLDHVMLTVGLLFMAIAAATFIWGPSQQPVHMPDYLTGQKQLGFLNLNIYRLFLILAGGLVIAGLIWAVDATDFGAKVRAAVDNSRVTASCGIDVDKLFMATFFIGSALAGLGGALSINLLGLDPNFAQSFLAFVLIVVVIGGEGSMRGTLFAALLLGIADVVGKYYVPQAGAFIIYALTVIVLFFRPQGLFAIR